MAITKMINKGYLPDQYFEEDIVNMVQPPADPQTVDIIIPRVAQTPVINQTTELPAISDPPILNDITGGGELLYVDNGLPTMVDPGSVYNLEPTVPISQPGTVSPPPESGSQNKSKDDENTPASWWLLFGVAALIIILAIVFSKKIK